MGCSLLTETVNKVSLSADDDKRVVMAIGHEGVGAKQRKDITITRNKSIVPRRTMHTGRMSGHTTKKDVNYYVNNYHA